MDEISLERYSVLKDWRVSEDNPTRTCSGDKSDGHGKEPAMSAGKGALERTGYLEVRA